MASDSPVRIVIDYADDGTLSTALGPWTGPATPVVVVNPTPRMSTARDLSAEILVALGKPFDALDREEIRPDDHDQAWDLALVWLRAEGIRHLVVLDPHRLAPKLRPLLTRIAGPRCAVWLVVRRDDDARAFAEGPTARFTVDALLASLPPASPAGGVSSAPAVFARFREIAGPASACAMTLAAIADVDPCSLAGLPRRSVGTTARGFSLGGRRFPVPTYAQSLVRAQLLVRPAAHGCIICRLIRHEPSDENDPLFFTARGYRPTSPELASWLRRSTGSFACRNRMLNIWPAPHYSRRGRMRRLWPPYMTTCRTH